MLEERPAMSQADLNFAQNALAESVHVTGEEDVTEPADEAAYFLNELSFWLASSLTGLALQRARQSVTIENSQGFVIKSQL